MTENSDDSNDSTTAHIDIFDLSTHIPYRLAVLSNTIRQSTTDRYVKGTGMSAREWRVLGMIGLKGSITAATAADLTGMDRATITRAMSKLMELGYAEKRQNHQDGRSQWLVLTDEGAKKCAEIIPQMSEDGKYYQQLLTEEELNLLINIINRFQTAADERLKSCNPANN